MTWDNKWSAVSALAAVAALILAVLLPILSRDTKELTVETVSTAILADLSDPALSLLKLTYKGVSVSRLTVVTIEFRNSGTRSIERADFELPVILRFQNPVDVLAVTLSEKIPEGLKPLISSDLSGISVAPLLLNPGDQFRITVQLRGDFNEPAVEARISGVSSISRQMFKASHPTNRELALLAAGVFTTCIYLYFIGFSRVTSFHRPFALMPRPEIFVVALAMAMGSGALISAGIKGLQLTNMQLYVGLPLVAILILIVIMPFASWRALRLSNNPLGQTPESPTR